MPNEIQQIVDQVADTLQKSVTLCDVEIRLIAASRHYGDEDKARIFAMLQREPMREVYQHIQASGALKWQRPGFIPPNSDIGFAGRIAIPIRGVDSRLSGFLMVITGTDSLLTETPSPIRDEWSRMLGGLLPAGTVKSGREAVDEAVAGVVSVDPERHRRGRELLDELGLVAGGHLVVVAMDPDAANTSNPLSNLERILHELPRNAVWSKFADGEGVSAVVIADRTVISQVTAKFRTLSQTTSNTPPPSIGICGVDDVDCAPLAYRRGLICRRVATRGRYGRCVSWDDLGMLGRLLDLPAPAVQALTCAELDALYAHDPTGYLPATLFSYLHHGGSHQKTAADLHVHRTSLYYRIDQIESITGMDLSNGDDRLELHMGLVARDALDIISEQIHRSVEKDPTIVG